MSLQVEAGKPFRICQLTDIHLGECPLNESDQKTLLGIKKTLTENEFDLIMLTGDLIWGKDNLEPRKTLQELFKVLNEFAIPVAITYGNHDTEGPYNRKYLRDFESELDNLADKSNAYVVDDRENFTLEITDRASGELVNVIYVWDSGDYSRWPEISLYAIIDRCQIEWYQKTAQNYNAKTLDIGFMHIPLPEYKEVNKEEVSGFFNKRVCSPDINSGLFYEILSVGKIKALFAGHDHDNNFAGKFAGVMLNYGNVTGYNAYGDLDRGVLEIDLFQDHVERRVITF